MAQAYFWNFILASLIWFPYPMFYNTPWQGDENPYPFLACYPSWYDSQWVPFIIQCFFYSGDIIFSDVEMFVIIVTRSFDSV